jgi:predicted ATP-grasp superfamily ATP-dependent carboligase
MGAKPALLVGLCLCFLVTAVEAGSSGAASGAQINIPNINPDVARRFDRLQQKEENERMQKQNSDDAQKLVLLASELRQYSEAVENDGVSPEAVRKASEVEKLAKRIHGRLKERAHRLRPH